MNWFGDRWDSPLCRRHPRVRTPVGKRCEATDCGEPIDADDQGVILPRASRPGEAPGMRRAVWHRSCWGRRALR